MDQKKLIAALGRMKVETGRMVCFGCGHEHNCGVRGCALIRAAQETLSTLQAENEKLRAELERMKRIMRDNRIMTIPSKYPGGPTEWNIPKPRGQKEE